MIEQALRVANKLGLPPDQTARLIATAEQNRREVVRGFSEFYTLGRLHYDVIYAPASALPKDRPPCRRQGQRRGCNSWD